MDHLLGGKLGLTDFIFVHLKGKKAIMNFQKLLDFKKRLRLNQPHHLYINYHVPKMGEHTVVLWLICRRSEIRNSTYMKVN
jgi:hypothetical protein